MSALMRPACATLPLVLVALLLGAPRTAQATYSIVAVDRDARTLGGAVASCVSLDVVARVYAAVPGRGAIVTQSYLFDPASPTGVELLGQGASPGAIVSALTDPAFDPDFELRQYAVVDVVGGLAAFTGGGALPYAGDVPFEHGALVGSAQGNILTGPAVVEAAIDGFVDDASCDLAERLVRALEAGGADGLGDARCTPSGTPAKAATVEVDDASGPILRIAVEAPGDPPSESPLIRVRAELDAWRATHPCPTPTDAPPSTPTGPGSERTDTPVGCATAPAPAAGALVASSLLLAAFAFWRRRAIDIREPG